MKNFRDYRLRYGRFAMVGLVAALLFLDVAQANARPQEASAIGPILQHRKRPLADSQATAPSPAYPLQIHFVLDLVGPRWPPELSRRGIVESQGGEMVATLGKEVSLSYQGLQMTILAIECESGLRCVTVTLREHGAEKTETIRLESGATGGMAWDGGKILFTRTPESD